MQYKKILLQHLNITNLVNSSFDFAEDGDTETAIKTLEIAINEITLLIDIYKEND